MIGYYGINENQKIANYYNAKEYMAYVQLNYNFVHVVLKKQWARPKTCCRKLQALSNGKLKKEARKVRTGKEKQGKMKIWQKEDWLNMDPIKLLVNA